MSEKRDIQELIDKFAAYDIDTLQEQALQITQHVKEFQSEIDSIENKIKSHREIIERLEAEQKAISDRSWPYSLMQLTIEKAIEQKQAQS